MPYLLAIILAVVLIFAASFGYGMTQAERELNQARADAIRTEAAADAFATRMVALAPIFLITAGGIVFIIFGLAAYKRAGRLAPTIENHYHIKVEQHPGLYPGEVFGALPAPSEEFLGLLSAPQKFVELPAGEFKRLADGKGD